MKLAHLPAHITGFFETSGALPSVDFSEFKAACFQVAQITGGAITSFDCDLSGKNFFVATMKNSDGDISLLCNSIYPYLAFVLASSHTTDAPELAFERPAHISSYCLQGTAFHLLDTDWLLSPPCEDLLTDLASVEKEQVKHWKPQRVGDIVFNYWD